LGGCRAIAGVSEGAAKFAPSRRDGHVYDPILGKLALSPFMVEISSEGPQEVRPGFRVHAEATLWDQPEGMKEKWLKKEG
jgi:hypothetical protein